MSIRYITEGDESRTKELLGEGRHQLSILKNLMSFQKLQQLQRVVRFNDGTIIKCLSCFGQDVINIFVPVRLVEKKRNVIEVFHCWCTDYFTEGIITKIYHKYGDRGTYEGYYPNCLAHMPSGYWRPDLSAKNYIGIRYGVSLCQGTKRSSYICIPSDFAKYKVKDKVIIFMRGIWKRESLNYNPKNRTPERSCVNNPINTCIACKGNRRPNHNGNEADGSFLICPLKFEGVNNA